MKKIFVPFDAPGFFNGAHPLVNGFTKINTDRYEFVRYSETDVGGHSEVLQQVNTFADQLFDICRISKADLSTKWEVILNFISSRRLDIQQKTPSDAALSFYHTLPYSLNNNKYIIHIETVSQLFVPFIYQGVSLGYSLNNHLVYHFVKHLLESKTCLKVFTNLNFTVGQLSEVFKSDVINSKVVFVSPSCSWDSGNSQLVKKIDWGDIKILFTNSFHDQPNSFYLRGGFDIVNCVLELSNTFSNVSLTIRSSVPPDLKASEIWSRIKVCKNIRWIDEYLSDEELSDIYSSHNIFFLNSVALHSMSLLRAMDSGLVCIVSDAPGVDEYIQDAFNGIVIKGLRERLCRVDSTGWIYDDWSTFWDSRFKPSVNYPHLKNLITQMARGKVPLEKYSLNAIETIGQKFQPDASNKMFLSMLDSIL